MTETCEHKRTTRFSGRDLFDPDKIFDGEWCESCGAFKPYETWQLPSRPSPKIPTDHELAMAMQDVDFDSDDVVMLKGKKFQIISISAGVKLATAIKKMLETKGLV